MPRFHIMLPDDLMAQIKDVCARNSMVKSKFVVRAIQMAVDDARKRFGEVANEAARPPPTPPTLARSLAPGEFDIATIRRGEATLFDVKAVCDALAVPFGDLCRQIDHEDDILTYAGKDWIDIQAINEAAKLCQSSVGPTLITWAEAQ